MKKSMLFSLIFLMLFFTACSRAEDGPAKEEEKLHPMPAFVLKDLDGNVVSSDHYKGKVLVINFWATWCGPCISEIPDLNEIYNKYEDKDFDLLAIASQSGDAATLKKHVERLGIEYPVLVGDDVVVRKYQIFAFPTDYIVDREGNIQNRIVGAPPGKKAQVVRMIDELLEE